MLTEISTCSMIPSVLWMPMLGHISLKTVFLELCKERLFSLSLISCRWVSGTWHSCFIQNFHTYVHTYIQTFIMRFFYLDQSAKVENNSNKNTKQVSILDKGETSTSFWTQSVICLPDVSREGIPQTRGSDIVVANTVSSNMCSNKRRVFWWSSDRTFYRSESVRDEIQ